MAKYSRSALSMKESLREISTQKAEKFLNTFYFQYGHRSIADLAHIALAIERLSILAAIAVADEQRWDGQERPPAIRISRRAATTCPILATTGGRAQLYRETLDSLFAEYEALSERMFLYLAEHHSEARRNEAGRLRAHVEGPRFRFFALSAAAGDEYFAGRNRQCAHA